jgi:HSP20 family protein
MALVRFRPFSAVPFRDLSEIQSEMNRLFDGLFDRPSPLGSSEPVWTPAVDMHETKDELVVTVEMAGVPEKDIRLSITGDVLTIRGERLPNPEAKQNGHSRVERWYGKFERVLTLPIPVQTDQVRATYRDGVLTITLPKVEEVKPKEIKIEVA